ncbi:MAG: hydrogenase nickel incorporation protein HypB [Symploca sp. SIO1C4]|uniref:Hydrogenase nickel incorporation protein HypB n=1 Tax=Symploca sp. SIO1C4 TaxID=2607765 RepID=A0A6B3NB50_9CYAN|nr:hydrogenase nickel incorporation protein HypB [Symploca sp. SIO1C4]
MCVTCGCAGDGDITITNPQKYEPVEIVANGNKHNHTHNNDYHYDHSHTLADGTVITHTHTHDSHLIEEEDRSRHGKTSTIAGEYSTFQVNSQDNSLLHAQMHGTTISLEKDILAKNNLMAAQNRGWFKGRNILALNLVSSPGAGKTTLLTRTINDLKGKLSINVIEGDQETINDALKIKETGCKVVQINTGTGCHLDAEMVEKGYTELNPPLGSVVMIENVGNLVCPALFDLGEQAKVAILSITEGEDKPIKYPHMFRASQVMILNKIDLLPYVQFNLERCIEYTLQVNPKIKIFQVSAITGAGLENWYEWLYYQHQGLG